MSQEIKGDRLISCEKNKKVLEMRLVYSGGEIKKCLHTN